MKAIPELNKQLKKFCVHFQKQIFLKTQFFRHSQRNPHDVRIGAQLGKLFAEMDGKTDYFIPNEFVNVCLLQILEFFFILHTTTQTKKK
jgi:hypothetical protein